MNIKAFSVITKLEVEEWIERNRVPDQCFKLEKFLGDTLFRTLYLEYLAYARKKGGDPYTRLHGSDILDYVII